ncbi:MAG: single-stranded DNA-binding protein [Anaerolineales bacterium]|jgi:single-strand DNA-binding protein|nr:single-stranded DNA-binding protein [Anaerolineales bacterium]
MTRGLNKVMLIGRLGHDPEMRYTPSGRPLTKFQLAVNRSWKSADGEKKTETEWFNVVTWGKLAEICNQYLTKGQQVYIEGRLHTRQWQDEEGSNHSSVEVIAKEMLMLNSKSGEQDSEPAEGVFSEDEYPF